MVDSRELSVDLIDLDMEDFDIILGMDWLVRYGATIDYRNKMVTFEPEGDVLLSLWVQYVDPAYP